KKALQALEQVKQRVANDKKKQNEKKRKAEKPLTHNPLFPMPKMKAGAIRNDKSRENEKPRGKFHLHGLLRRAFRTLSRSQGKVYPFRTQEIMYAIIIPYSYSKLVHQK
ncbi:MAG: hypothetical protein K2N90_05685, partial [Lachnospiraceae bacterium]|nr:hypothetical protein [Lachnospiraceae bacterium]